MKKAAVKSTGLSIIIKIIVALLLILVVWRGSVALYEYGYRIFMEPAMTEGEGRVVTVEITPEMEAEDIGKLFEEKGLIRDAGLFKWQYQLSEYVKKVQPGTFELSTAMTVEEMMQVMAGIDLEAEE